MGLSEILSSKNTRTLSALSTLVQAGLALYRGNTKVAALLVGAAVLSYRTSWVGMVAQVAIQLYQRMR
ncbi:hypothetical protein [Halomarina litorea]|uniref:hypothetical protein n=1 Tax=Halomarina litorea TaxID=2961595 RepID=UPI0020C48C2A|nr:hypothetical protein [Halomarina sp. BCD28]